MPNINFWTGDQIYSKWVNLPTETRKKLKDEWRKQLAKAVKDA